ncbi:MAG: hypothetical protein ACOC80_10290, partial [Petrotogales bacterium]
VMPIPIFMSGGGGFGPLLEFFITLYIFQIITVLIKLFIADDFFGSIWMFRKFKSKKEFFYFLLVPFIPSIIGVVKKICSVGKGE